MDVVPEATVSGVVPADSWWWEWEEGLLWHVTGLFGGLCMALILGHGAGCGAVGLADDRDDVGWGAYGVVSIRGSFSGLRGMSFTHQRTA